MIIAKIISSAGVLEEVKVFIASLLLLTFFFTQSLPLLHCADNKLVVQRLCP